MGDDPLTVCACHGEPCYWQKDRRLTAGGRWECAVRRRQRQRDIYDADPIYRIARQLHQRRGRALARKKERLRG